VVALTNDADANLARGGTWWFGNEWRDGGNVKGGVGMEVLFLARGG